MGTRQMDVSADLLVEMAKAPGDRHRSFTITNPLPTDARIVAVEPRWLQGAVRLLLASEVWDGDSTELVHPTFMVHFAEETG